MKNLFTLLLLLAFSSILSAQEEGTPDVIRGNESYTLLINTNDAQNADRLSDVELYLYTTADNKLVSQKTTKHGVAEFDINPLTEYEVRTCHSNYFRNGISIFECHEGNEVVCVYGASEYYYVAGGGKEKPRAVLKAEIDLSPMSIGSVFELSNVYYDLDEATLRPRGKAELDQLAQILERNKSITIELSSHTDSRASDQYNKDLSQKRAMSCLDYLVSKGIKASRITPKGYGESKLLNECTDGVECTEAQHQKNRRTEIEVLTYSPIECKPSMDVDFTEKDLEKMEK